MLHLIQPSVLHCCLLLSLSIFFFGSLSSRLGSLVQLEQGLLGGTANLFLTNTAKLTFTIQLFLRDMEQIFKTQRSQPHSGFEAWDQDAARGALSANGIYTAMRSPKFRSQMTAPPKRAAARNNLCKRRQET